MIRLGRSRLVIKAIRSALRLRLERLESGVVSRGALQVVVIPRCVAWRSAFLISLVLLGLAELSLQLVDLIVQLIILLPQSFVIITDLI